MTFTKIFSLTVYSSQSYMDYGSVFTFCFQNQQRVKDVKNVKNVKCGISTGTNSWSVLIYHTYLTQKGAGYLLVPTIVKATAGGKSFLT